MVLDGMNFYAFTILAMCYRRGLLFSRRSDAIGRALKHLQPNYVVTPKALAVSARLLPSSRRHRAIILLTGLQCDERPI